MLPGGTVPPVGKKQISPGLDCAVQPVEACTPVRMPELLVTQIFEKQPERVLWANRSKQQSWALPLVMRLTDFRESQQLPCGGGGGVWH
jgi:hypothetical protein